MIIIKTEEEITKLREGGKRHGAVLKAVAEAVKPGITTADLDVLARDLIKAKGDESAFLGYRPDWASKPFPASICVSINEEIVHGIPSKDRIIQQGDLVKIDIGYKYQGVFTDAAVTVGAGAIDAAAKKLIAETRKALYAGIDAAKVGKPINNIGEAIEKVWDKAGFTTPHSLCGHGVGRYIHEDPYVLNEKATNRGPALQPGMVLAIEPMLNEGGPNILTKKDGGHICLTADGKRSAHFEHTVLITENGPEILTELP